MADITNLNCRDDYFEKVVAGNVIHLLPEPEKAVHELERVVKPGGMIIIPTYITISKGKRKIWVEFIKLLGTYFKREFDLRSYKSFFARMGYENVKYYVVYGQLTCAVLVIKV